MVANPKLGFVPLKEKSIKYKAGSGTGIRFKKQIEEYAQERGIGYMIDENSTIVISCIEPGEDNMELLMHAYEREIGFSEKGKNQKDRDGSTIRSFHSSTSPVMVTISTVSYTHLTLPTN